MLLFSKGGDSMGMGWHTLAHESSELKSKRPCKCGKGFIFHSFITPKEPRSFYTSEFYLTKLSVS